MASTHANSLMLAHNDSGNKVALKCDSSNQLKTLSKISDGTNMLSVNSDGSVSSNSKMRGTDSTLTVRDVLVSASGKLEVVSESSRPTKTSSTISTDSSGSALNLSLGSNSSTESVSLGSSNKVMFLIKGTPSSSYLNLEVSDDDSVWHSSGVNFYTNTNDSGSTYDIVGTHDSILAKYVRVKNVDATAMGFTSFSVVHQ